MYSRTMLSSLGMTMMDPASECIVHFIYERFSYNDHGEECHTLMSGKSVVTTPSITPHTWAMRSL